MLIEWVESVAVMQNQYSSTLSWAERKYIYLANFSINLKKGIQKALLDSIYRHETAIQADPFYRPRD